MVTTAYPRHQIVAVVLIAFFAALLCAAPAAFQPQRAQAQGDSCNGAQHNQRGNSCGNNNGNSNSNSNDHSGNNTWNGNNGHDGDNGWNGNNNGNDHNGNNGWNGDNNGNDHNGNSSWNGDNNDHGDHDHNGNYGYGNQGVWCSGTFYAQANSCPSMSTTVYQSCPDGSQIPLYQSCPFISSVFPTVSTFTCPDGTVINVGGSCPYAGGSLTCYGTYSPIGACGGGTVVTYPAGWNLVGAPSGTILTGASGPLYTLPPGASSYVVQPPGTPLQGGVGYWVYFPTPTTVTLAPASAPSTTISLPPGPFVLIGNPSDTTVSVGGYGVTVLTYDPVSNGYAPTTQLNPGQAAWAASPAGGTLVVGVGPFGPAGGPPPPPPPL